MVQNMHNIFNIDLNCKFNDIYFDQYIVAMVSIINMDTFNQ
jgi:hypothetical protein